MRKWIVMALFNWLRKPANRQKAKAAWNDLRGQQKRPSGASSPSSSRNASRHPHSSRDHRR